MSIAMATLGFHRTKNSSLDCLLMLVTTVDWLESCISLLQNIMKNVPTMDIALFYGVIIHIPILLMDTIMKIGCDMK